VKLLPLTAAFSILAAGAARAAEVAPMPDSVHLTPSEEARVKRGEVVVHAKAVGPNLTCFLVTGLVNEPVSLVLQVETDTSRYRQIFNMVSRPRLLDRSEGRAHYDLAYSLPWPIGERWAEVETTTDPARHLIRIKRLKGTMREYETLIQAFPEGDRTTRLRLSSVVDMGLPIPGWLLNWMGAKAAPTAVTDLRRYLNEHPNGSDIPPVMR